jgi:hypothetical protein
MVVVASPQLVGSFTGWSKKSPDTRFRVTYMILVRLAGILTGGVHSCTAVVAMAKNSRCEQQEASSY